MTPDFTTWTTQQLLQAYQFHDNDRGTDNLENEIKRCWIVQEIGLVLQRRNVQIPRDG